MLYIENSSKKTIVLKSFENPTIRLFPGFNEINIEKQESLAPYFTPGNSNTARLTGYKKSVLDYDKENKDSSEVDNYIQSRKTVHVKSSITFVSKDDLYDDDIKRQASNARKFNEYLNKSALTIVKQSKQIDKQDTIVSDQQKEISELKSMMLEMQKQLNKKK